MQSNDSFETVNQEKETHLRDYLLILYSRKGLVLTITLISIVVTTLFAFSKTPIYTATTKVLIEKNITGGTLEGLRMYMVWDPQFMDTQFELIRSFNVARRVVNQLHLDTRYKKSFIKQQNSHRSLLQWLKGSIAALFKPKSSEKKNTPTGQTAKQTVEQEAQHKTDADTIAAMIQGGIQVTPIKDTKIVRISYSHEDPVIAQKVANSIVQAYINETLDIKTSMTKYSLQWMTTKADEERQKLEESEKALQKYMRDNDIITVENKLSIYPEKLSQFSSELSSAQAKAKEFEAIYSQIEKAGDNLQLIETIPLLANNPVLQDLRSRIYASEQNIKELSKKFGYKHPTIIQAKSARDLLLKEKKEEIKRIIESTKNEYELAKTRTKDLAQLIATTKAEIQDMNERFIQYTIMKREMEMNRSVYDALSTSIKKENVTEQSQDIKIWVTRKAEVPGAPSQPNRKKEILRGLLLGLFGGVAAALFLEYLDNTIKSEIKIEERYKLPVLGTVEDLKDKNSPFETYIQDNPLSPFAESYRLIRANLLLSSSDHPPKILLITSMIQQEGKTSTTGNLAHILAQNNSKVLIIDCDMRRPRQHSLFGIANAYGLSNYLSGNMNESQTMIHPTENEDISLIAAGPVPPNPAELLQSKKLVRLLDKASQQFDFILLDSPPVQQVTDNLMMGHLVDGIILVIRAGKTTYDMLDRGIKKLRDGRAQILGVILNRLKTNRVEQGYYGYYSYYSSKEDTPAKSNNKD